MKKLSILFSLLTLSCSNATNSMMHNKDSHAQTSSEQGGSFRPLFDGASLANWTALDAQSQNEIGEQDRSFSVQDGMIYCSGVGKDYWLRENGVYGDFVVHLEYKLAEKTNSGIFLRAPAGKHPAYFGFEIQILDDYGRPPGKHTSGAVYDVITPAVNASRPAGLWNEVEIRCQGALVTVVLNGQTVIDADFDTLTEPIGKFSIAYRDLHRKGYFGVQNHGGKIWFRNLRIKPL